MIVTIRNIADPCQFVRFTWSDDFSACEFIALGDDAAAAAETMVAQDLHKGAGDLAGWTVELS